MEHWNFDQILCWLLIIILLNCIIVDCFNKWAPGKTCWFCRYCVRVFFNPCPSFPMVPEGTDLLECKQPWITVGSLFQLHKATKLWEQSFTQLVIIRVYNSGTASQMKLTPRIPYLLRTFTRFVFKEDFGCFFLFLGFSQYFSRQCSFATTPLNCWLVESSI